MAAHTWLTKYFETFIYKFSHNWGGKKKKKHSPWLGYLQWEEKKWIEMAVNNTYEIRDLAGAWHQYLENKLSVKCSASGNILFV